MTQYESKKIEEILGGIQQEGKVIKSSYWIITTKNSTKVLRDV